MISWFSENSGERMHSVRCWHRMVGWGQLHGMLGVGVGVELVRRVPGSFGDGTSGAKRGPATSGSGWQLDGSTVPAAAGWRIATGTVPETDSNGTDIRVLRIR